MNLLNPKSRFLFATYLVFVAVFVVMLSGLIITPVNAETDGWHIKDDATGGDCTLIGNWDAASKTCTLTQNLDRGIVIDNNYITLDGNGHTITGTGAGDGVYLSGRTGVTIKNLNVKQFSYGINLYQSSSNTLINNSASNNTVGINLYSSGGNTLTNNSAYIQVAYSNNSTLTGNTASYIQVAYSNNSTLTGNTASYIQLAYSNNSTLTGNTALNNNYYGIFIFYSDNNTLIDNTVSNNSGGIYIYASSNNTLTGNTISNNAGGISLINAFNTQIYNNNFINNSRQVIFHSSSGNTFNLAAPIGGNYWSNYSTPAQRCVDLNNDGFCDAPYVFSGGQDNLPWTKQDGWLTPQNNLIVEFEQTPLFQEANFLPDQSVTRWVKVTNNSSQTKRIATEAINVSDPDQLGDALNLEIKENGITKHNNSLSRFFTAGEVYLSDLGKYGEQTQYEFIITFYSGASNLFQGKSLGFDILIGFQKAEGGYFSDTKTSTGNVFTSGTWEALENQPPTLSYSLKEGYESNAESPGVEPNEGTAEQTSFVFRIIYTDVDNDPPVEVTLLLQKLGDYPDFPLIDYGEYALLEEDPQDTDYTDGKEYFISIPLSEGKFRYYFRAGQLGLPAPVVTAPFPPLTPGEDAKWLEVGTNEIPIPDEVLSAEDIYYNTLKNDLRESTFIYSEMLTKKTIETTFSLITKGLTQSWAEIAKLDKAAQLREMTKKVAMNVFSESLVDKLKDKASYPTDVMTNIVMDILEKGFLLENHSGKPFQEVVDNIHNGFVATTLNISPDNEIINKSVERLGRLNNLAETTSYEAEAMKRKFDLFEGIKNDLGAYNLFIKLGGNFAEIRSEKEKNVAAGVLALTTSQAFSTIKSFISFDQWLALMDWYGELWLVEDRATRLFRKGAEDTVHVLNTGEFPVVAVDMINEITPEAVELGSIGTFGGILKNTGGETIEARLIVTITEPSLFLEGWPRIFTTETVSLPPNSEETPFTIDVPFFGGLPLINTGKATVQTTVEYGVLGLEYSTENEQKTFEITHNLFPIIKTIKTNLDGLSDNTLISIYIANNEPELKKFTVVDEIPKSLSLDLSNVNFSTPPDRIINQDPVVAWDVELAPGEFVILTYEITAGEIDNIFTFPHAEIVGDGIQKQSSLTVIDEEDAQSLGNDSLDLLVKAIESASASAFKNENIRNALLAKINEIVRKAQSQEINDAINKLVHDIRPKIDGQKSPKDWIIAEDTRLILIELVDSAVVFLSNTFQD
jgi:parallel beta-helix repeat protein